MIRLKAPARICLFGEHQDYLNYPVIAMAISKYIYLEASRISDQKFIIDLPNINDKLEFQLNNKKLEYKSNRDYLRSGYNQFLRKGAKFNKGYFIKITGDIPINAGAASSSAFVIAWLSFLNFITGEKISKKQLADIGYQAEVAEFGEAGGKMDFYTSIYGNVIYLHPSEGISEVIEIPLKLDGFVLGDSKEKKDTVEDLRRVKILSKNAFKSLKEVMPEFKEYLTNLEDVKPFLPSLDKEHQDKIVGNIINRDLTLTAKKIILKLKKHIDHFPNSDEISNFYYQLGVLLNKHQTELKEHIKISTPKIDRMIAACIKAGALGAKINGSGFGGTMFALFPNNQKSVQKAIENAGGKAIPIKTSNGIEHY
jgi:galactokinase